MIAKHDKKGLARPTVPPPCAPGASADEHTKRDKALKDAADNVFRMECCVRFNSWDKRVMASLPYSVQIKYQTIELEKGGANAEVRRFS